MTRIDLTVRAICEYAARRELAYSGEGVLLQDGGLILPALVTDPDLDAVLARHGDSVTA